MVITVKGFGERKSVAICTEFLVSKIETPCLPTTCISDTEKDVMVLKRFCGETTIESKFQPKIFTSCGYCV